MSTGSVHKNAGLVRDDTMYHYIKRQLLRARQDAEDQRLQERIDHERREVERLKREVEVHRRRTHAVSGLVQSHMSDYVKLKHHLMLEGDENMPSPRATAMACWSIKELSVDADGNIANHKPSSPDVIEPEVGDHIEELARSVATDAKKMRVDDETIIDVVGDNDANDANDGDAEESLELHDPVVVTPPAPRGPVHVHDDCDDCCLTVVHCAFCEKLLWCAKCAVYEVTWTLAGDDNAERFLCTSCNNL